MDQNNRSYTQLTSQKLDVPGLVFRSFQGEADYSKMAAVIAASAKADNIERVDSAEDVARYYSHLTNCDPDQDMLIAEVLGEVIGYAHVTWWDELEDVQIYRSRGYLMPEWRRKGIGSIMLKWCEERLSEIATQKGGDISRYFQSSASDSEEGTQALLESYGYMPVRHFFTMVRPNLDDIPEAVIPDGLEVRPVHLEHLQAIRDAKVEAFRDHWGFSEVMEPSVEEWKEDPNFDPDLWQVAWDGDQVAGMVLPFINQKENQEYNRLRGWTEEISVRRPWRKRGLARALLVRSLRAIQERGMQEAALGVDTENLSGALRLYEGVGFRPVKRWTTYRKPMKGFIG